MPLELTSLYKERCEFSSSLQGSCQKLVCCFCQNIFLLHLESLMFKSQQSLHSQNMPLINVCRVFLRPVREQIICETWGITSLVSSWTSSVWFCSVWPTDSSCLNLEINWDVSNFSGSSEWRKTEEFTWSLTFLYVFKIQLAFSISFSIWVDVLKGSSLCSESWSLPADLLEVCEISCKDIF